MIRSWAIAVGVVVLATLAGCGFDGPVVLSVPLCARVRGDIKSSVDEAYIAVAADACRSVDGRLLSEGQSFDVLGRGLPDRHAYHLVYRHALDVDGSGDRLAMGSTTGSVWVSEDAGDEWSLVSSTLPPVACVRWLR